MARSGGSGVAGIALTLRRPFEIRGLSASGIPASDIVYHKLSDAGFTEAFRPDNMASTM